jgi:hypothetical protein
VPEEKGREKMMEEQNVKNYEINGQGDWRGKEEKEKKKG